jgi:hypothetical protein
MDLLIKFLEITLVEFYIGISIKKFKHLNQYNII